MSRSRIVKPEFFKHSDLYAAEVESGLPLRLGFQGLWLVADREGRFKWRPAELKLEVLPYDPVDFAAVLDALERHGYVQSYFVEGKRYGVIHSLRKHQSFHPHEAQSKLPVPPMSLDAHTLATNEEQCTPASTSTSISISISSSNPGTDELAMNTVYRYWQGQTGNEDLALTTSRQQLILARLSEGYTVEQLQTVIEWAAADPWMNGTDPKSRGYLDFDNLIGSNAKVDRYLLAAKRPRDPRNNWDLVADPSKVTPTRRL